MTISMRGLTVGTFVPLLKTLSEVLDKGAAHAVAKGYDPAILIDSRLSPDMLPLWFQVQFGCHQATAFTAVLLGSPAQEFDREQATDLAALQAQVASAIAQLEAWTETDFEGSATREVVFPLQGGAELHMPGLAFLQLWIAPQVYFHVVTAYAILRHNGVELGIRDYLSQIGHAVRVPGQPVPA
jgi:hypothetical protein